MEFYGGDVVAEGGGTKYQLFVKLYHINYLILYLLHIIYCNYCRTIFLFLDFFSFITNFKRLPLGLTLFLNSKQRKWDLCSLATNTRDFK